MSSASAVNSAKLTAAVVSLVREFGLHRPEETPCGQPVAVAEAHALMDLVAAGPMNQKELAGRLRLEKSTVSRLVVQMERQGWVRKADSAHDARVVSVSLTRAGRAQASKLAQARQAKFERILTAIPRGHRARVIRAVSVLAAASRSLLYNQGPLHARLGMTGK